MKIEITGQRRSVMTHRPEVRGDGLYWEPDKDSGTYLDLQLDYVQLTGSFNAKLHFTDVELVDMLATLYRNNRECFSRLIGKAVVEAAEADRRIDEVINGLKAAAEGAS